MSKFPTCFGDISRSEGPLGIRCHHCSDMNSSARSCANRNAKAN